MLTPALIKKLIAAADRVWPASWELARSIFERPELGYQEFFAADSVTAFLSRRGFKIKRPLARIDTAFAAEIRGRKSPRLAFLAEMDALPEVGHACGHHLIAASSAGAAAALAEVFPSPPGSIAVIGCPAEEGGGGKVYLARAGVFNGLDAALMVHPDRQTEIYKRSLGVVEMALEFFGRAAHASAYPEDGINALDAVIETFNAINALRQQLPDTTRVHGIITHGGKAANITPDYTRAVFMARGTTVAETLEVAAKVRNCARGAALAAGVTLKVKTKLDVMYAPYVPNRAMGEAFRQALVTLAIPIEQGPEDKHIGSSDVGNACLSAPLLHPQIAVPGATEGVHSLNFARAAGGEGGRRMLGQAIRALTLTGARILLDPVLRAAIHQEHREMVKRQKTGAAPKPLPAKGRNAKRRSAKEDS
jgi:amidohydrolase